MNTVVEIPWALLAAPAFAAAIALLVWLAFRRRARRLAKLGSAPLLARLLPPAALTPPWPRVLVLALAAACAAVAYSGPRWGMETTIQRASGVDVVLALDASLSMMAPDERPNRLERMKEEARRLLALSVGDRIGLIAFAGHSYVLSPLTVDHGALQLFIDNLDPSVVGVAGSSLARAVTQATDLLQATPSGSDKAIVLMSDGEGFEDRDELAAAAKRAADAGITVVTVGFGTESGSTIPIPAAGGGVTQKRDFQGRVVITRYEPDMLELAAGETGTFIPADATDKAARVRHALAQLHAAGREAQRATDRRARFQLFLLPALLLVLLDTLLAERHGRRPHAPAAASTAVAAALLIAMLPAAARAQGREGDRLYSAGRYREAADAYARAAQGRGASPRLAYDLGTSLLESGQLDEAASALERAANESKDLDLRYRALYNLGLALLRQARAAKGEEAGQAFSASADAYKKALRLRPDALDAKWNYELATRPRSPSGSKEKPGSGPPRPNQGIDPQQAQALLNSAQREERDTRAKQQKQSVPERPPGGKDW